MVTDEKNITTVKTGNRIAWIDLLKLLAIFAVFVDHTNGFLYTDQRVAYLSAFSVTLFILLSGMNSYLSYERRDQSGSEITWKNCESIKLKKLIFPYIIATACYLIFAYGVLDLRTLISSVLQFSASAPFYFIVFYLQLVIIARPLYYLIKSTSKIKKLPYIYIYIYIYNGVCRICHIIRFVYKIYIHSAGSWWRTVFIRRDLFADIFSRNAYRKVLS